MGKAGKSSGGGRYISAHNVAALKAYSYKGYFAGFVDRVIMNPLWNASVELVPMWVAPNLLTTISLFHAFVATFVICWHCPSLTETAPSWVFFLACYCMFLYQLLDAIDGKQARRTQSSSPLGQLFDHGCDAICAWLNGIFLVCTLQAGNTVFAFLVFLIPVIPFYLSNWEEANTSLMRFGVIGVTEGQFLVMGILLSTGILGQSMWAIEMMPMIERALPAAAVTTFKTILSVIPASVAAQLPAPFQLKHAMATFALSSGFVYQLVSSLLTVYHYCIEHRVSLFAAFYPVVQFGMFMVLSIAWVLCPYSTTFHDHPFLVMFIVGASFSYQISRIIIFHVTDESYVYLFKILIPFPLLVINEYLPRFKLDYGLPPYEAAVGFAIFVAILYAHFVYFTVTEICAGLGIKCFTIVKKEKKAQH